MKVVIEPAEIIRIVREYMEENHKMYARTSYDNLLAQGDAIKQINFTRETGTVLKEEVHITMIVEL